MRTIKNQSYSPKCQTHQKCQGSSESDKGQFNKQIIHTLVNQFNTKQTDMCQLHGKPFQVVCINDQVKVCTTCAIFGAHKGHQFKSIEEINIDKDNKLKEAINLIQENHNKYEKYVLKKQPLKQLLQELNTKKEEFVNYIKQQYANLHKNLEMLQSRAIEETSNYILNIQQKLKTAYIVSAQLETKSQKWELNILKSLEVCSSENHLKELLQLLNYRKTQTDILSEGYSLSKNYSDLLDKISQLRKQVFTTISVKMDPNILEKIKDYSQIVFQPINLDLKEKEVDQEDLLFISSVDSNNKIEMSPVNENRQQHVKKIHAKILSSPNNFETIYEEYHAQDQQSEEILSKNTIQIQTKTTASTINQDKISVCNSLMDTSFITEGNQNNRFHYQKNTSNSHKKKNKIKIPQKYEKVLEGIMNDQLQLVDLTNGELGDTVTLQIVELLKNKKAKSLKLIRNKLTDEGVDKMWKHFSNICTLNLSQNFLTDNFLDKLITNLHLLPNLKSITLSQNKIKQRNVKLKVETIKKKGIIVSL